jgi:salicylate hydroxylase
VHAYVLHRADLQRILYEAAIAAGATVLLGKHVTAPIADEPCLIFEDGSNAMGDLIVGTDGMHCILYDILCNQRSWHLLM